MHNVSSHILSVPSEHFLQFLRSFGRSQGILDRYLFALDVIAVDIFYPVRSWNDGKVAMGEIYS